MFVLKETNTFNWTVRVKVPKEGKYDTQTFKADFLALSPDEMKEMLDVATNETVKLKSWSGIVIGWTGVNDEDGNEIQFSEQVLDRLAAIPYVEAALGRAYYEAITGRKYAEKN